MTSKTVLIVGFGIDENRFEAVSKNTTKHQKILESFGYKVLVYNIGYKNRYFDTGSSFLESLTNRTKILENLSQFIEKNKVTHLLDVFVLPLSSQIFVLPLKSKHKNVTFIKELHNDAGFSLSFHTETIIRLLANSQLSLNAVVNGFDKLFTKNLFLAKQTGALYIPTDISIYERPKTKINSKKINICYLGHPLKKKGVFEFLDLFKIIPTSLKKQLVFNFAFSDLGQRKQVVAQFKTTARQHQIKVNFYDEVKPHLFFRKNDIYILPIHDHFGAVSTPNTILEAMEAGCLVITNKIKSLTGLMENDEVIYLDNHSAKHILDKLQFTLTQIDNEEKRLVKARSLIKRNHNLKNIKKLVRSIYE